MAIAAAERQRIQAQIDALRKRLTIDSNDLDYETHLHTIRTLQRILDVSEHRGAPVEEKKD